MNRKLLNCDANACYGVLPEVQAALAKFQLDYSNPSAIHQGGQTARAIVENARQSLALALNISSDQRIVFTSGATEANNMAVMFPFWQALASGEIANMSAVCTAIEHPSVLEAFRYLEEAGLDLRIISPEASGTIRPENVKALVDDSTRLLSMMSANNETGCILPVQEVFEQVKIDYPNCLLHTDAVQLPGKTVMDCAAMSADFISISGHKLGALTGIGALVVNDNLNVQALLRGGPQEQRYRAGTENLSGIYSMGIAAKSLYSEQETRTESLSKKRLEIISSLASLFPDLEFNCQNENTLANTVSVYIPGVLADDLVVAMDLAMVAVSSGSACASGKPLASHVLMAMGQSEERARATIRISFKSDLSEQDCRYRSDTFSEQINLMRSKSTELSDSYV